ncbi:MAG: anti-sigma-factor antagonist [Magnetococcales bacterium]|nr:anti-sigma-factor antagonist [Magnetococcales bacterium]HIJ82862.1 STAS domain-containing protein [Magnetococcales bacterium]
MIDFSVNDSGDTGTLVLSGGVTIQHAVQLKETLLEGISVAKRLVVNLSDLEKADLTAVQLLCAAHRSLNDKGKSLDIEGNIADAWHSAVKDSGYTGCINTNDRSGLWTGEGN